MKLPGSHTDDTVPGLQAWLRKSRHAPNSGAQGTGGQRPHAPCGLRQQPAHHPKELHWSKTRKVWQGCFCTWGFLGNQTFLWIFIFTKLSISNMQNVFVKEFFLSFQTLISTKTRFLISSFFLHVISFWWEQNKDGTDVLVALPD